MSVVPSTSSSSEGGVVNQIVNLQSVAPSARSTPEDNTTRNPFLQIVPETDSPHPVVQTLLIKTVEKHPKVWDWIRQEAPYPGRYQWGVLAMQMHRECGRMYQPSTLLRWWRSLENEFRSHLERNTQSTWCHSESMEFCRHLLQKKPEHWKRDSDFIKNEVNALFKKLEDDPTKMLEAKQKILNAIWDIERQDLMSKRQ